MQCGVEEKMIRSMKVAVMKCFKYRKKEHKCKKCLLWQKQVRVVCPVQGEV